MERKLWRHVLNGAHTHGKQRLINSIVNPFSQYIHDLVGSLVAVPALIRTTALLGTLTRQTMTNRLNKTATSRKFFHY